MKPHKTSILVIDDESDIRNSLKEFLEDFGYEVTEAGHAEEALELLESRDFDLAIVDLRLPGMSGDVFILEAAKRTLKMKYLIHTGSVGYRLSIELLELGLTNDDVFHKPIEDLMTLIDKIGVLLKNDE